MAILINDVPPRVRYVATSLQQTFAVPFEWLAITDLKVYRNGTLLTYDVTPANPNEYSVTGTGVTGGGTISLGSPYATLGDDILIIRDMPFERLTDFAATGAFPISSLNTELDGLVAKLQQVEIYLDRRALRLALTDFPETLSALPAKATRANKLLGFDEDGQPDLSNSVDTITALIWNQLVQAINLGDLTSINAIADALVAAATASAAASAASATAAATSATAASGSATAASASAAAAAASAAAAITSRIWYIAADGDDDGEGTRDDPLLTLSEAFLQASEGDVLRVCSGFVVREEIDFSSKKLTIEGYEGSSITFINLDEFSGTWSLDGAANRYSATISHSWGGSGVKEGANVYIPTLVQNGRRLQEVRVESGSQDYQFASEAAALAYVEATEGTFYVAGLNGSEFTDGWEAGNQTYYVHRFGSGNPNSDTWFVAQRRMYPFKDGSILSNINVVGSYYTSGIEAYDCRLNNVKYIFPAAHGFLIGGSTVVDCAVRGGNKSVVGYLGFHGISTSYKERTHLIRPTVIDFTGPSCSAFGSHGLVGNVTILGIYEIDDAYINNCYSVISNGNETDGIILRRLRAINLTSVLSATCNVRFEQPEISCNNQEGVNSGLFRLPTTGKRLEIIGPGFVSGEHYLSISSGSDIGEFYASDMTFMISNDGITAYWLKSSPAGDGYNFERCIIRAEGRFAGSLTFITDVNASTPFTMTDCLLDGVTPPSHATLVRTFTGDGRIRRLGNSVDYLINFPLADTGEALIGISAPTVAFASIVSIVAVTDKRIWTIGDQAGQGGVSAPVDFAEGEVSRGVVFCGTKVVVYGDNGLVYVSASGAGDSFAAVTSGLTTNFIGAVSPLDGTVYLLGDAGEIYLYDPAGPTFTSKTSGVTYPLKGGFYDGSEFVVVGGDGSTDGGILNSTDGTTWTEVYSTATYGKYLIDVTKINSVWIAITRNASELFTSSDGAAWTRYQGWDFTVGWSPAPKGLVANQQRNELWLYGAQNYDGSTLGREPKMTVFAVSGTGPNSWSRRDVNVTLPAITAGNILPSRSIGGTQNGVTMILGGPFLRFSSTVDGYEWQSWAPRRYSEPLEGLIAWQEDINNLLSM